MRTTQKTKHTPGQWTPTILTGTIESTFATDIKGNLVEKGGFYHKTIQICKIETRPLQNILTEEQQANIKMMAAAPNMLNALETIVSVLKTWNHEGKYSNLIEHAEKAIQKTQ